MDARVKEVEDKMNKLKRLNCPKHFRLRLVLFLPYVMEAMWWGQSVDMLLPRQDDGPSKI